MSVKVLASWVCPLQDERGGVGEHELLPSVECIDCSSTVGASAAERIFCCKFSGCGKSYASSDGVRKHCRKHHAIWLAELDRFAKEEGISQCSHLYCKFEGIPTHQLATHGRSKRSRSKPSAPVSAAGSGTAGITQESMRPAVQPMAHTPTTPIWKTACSRYLALRTPGDEEPFFSDPTPRDVSPLSLEPSCPIDVSDMGITGYSLGSPATRPVGNQMAQDQPSRYVKPVLGNVGSIGAAQQMSVGGEGEEHADPLLPEEGQSAYTFFSLCQHNMPPIKHGASLILAAELSCSVYPEWSNANEAPPFHAFEIGVASPQPEMLADLLS